MYPEYFPQDNIVLGGGGISLESRQDHSIRVTMTFLGALKFKLCPMDVCPPLQVLSESG